MNPSLHIKYGLAKFFQFSGLVKYVIHANSADKYPILMYHRVIPIGQTSRIQPGMFVSPATFEMHVRYLKRYFQIVSLEHTLESIDKKDFLRNDQPVCILTFDDGWHDFYEYAYPVLEEHQVPATVFLPTKFIGSKGRFWTDQLTELIARREPGTDRDEVAGNSLPDPFLKKILSLKGSKESITENAISLLKELREDRIWNILQQLGIAWDVAETYSDGVFLQWEEVRKMAGSGLVTFGSHTDSHKILTTLSEEEICEELIKSKETLLSKNAVHPSFIPFSYPNGNYDQKVVRLVKDAGYHVAVTTENGWNDPGIPLFSLRRMAVHQDMSSTKEMFGCRITNIF